jgi:tetratricopeptide (TPR) repeat protein
MYLVYDARGDAAYWLWVQPYLHQLDETRPGWRDQKTVQIRISRTNCLSPQSVPAIADAVQAWWARVVPTVGWDYAPSPQAARRPFQLPPDLPTFTGRESYLKDLDTLLHPGAGRTVSLVGLRGMAGVGKSALAVHAAHRWGDRFRDGVVWVDLRQRDVATALRHVAATYGYGDQAAQTPDVAGLAALVRTVLRRREALIILDNAEDVPPDQFPLLLPGATGCVTLVTSRRSFSELTRHGQMLRVGQMPEDEAKALLARILSPAADEADEAARGRLVERLGCLPLALDIAAQRMAERGWSAVEYVARLENVPSLVAELNLPLADRREESVLFAFALSYQVLTEVQQHLFHALGVMAEGGFAPPSVAGVLGEELVKVERGLEELALLSLVRPGELEGRYELHPLLADYSRALAREAGEWEMLRSAHLAHYVAYVQRYTRDYAALEAELANLMAAAEWSWQSGENNGVLDLAQWLYVGGGEFLDLQGHAREAVRLLAWAAEASRALGDRRGEGADLGTLGNAYSALGEVARAIEYYEQALQIAREIGDRRGEGNRLGNLRAGAADCAGDRRPARGRQPSGQPRSGLQRPGGGGAGHRVLRAGAADCAGDRRPARGGGGAGHRVLRAGAADCAGDRRPARGGLPLLELGVTVCGE